MKNTIQLIGNIGRDPEVIKTSAGTKMTKVSLATNESYKDKNGEFVTQTQWHNLVAWGSQAEYMEQNLRKGSYVGIRGKLRYNKYTNKDGIDQIRTEILVKEFLTPPERKNGESDESE